MPPGPGPLYNWLCVLHSASVILGHAATVRAAQVGRAAGGVALKRSPEIPRGPLTNEQDISNQIRNTSEAPSSYPERSAPSPGVIGDAQTLTQDLTVRDPQHVLSTIVRHNKRPTNEDVGGEEYSPKTAPINASSARSEAYDTKANRIAVTVDVADSRSAKILDRSDTIPPTEPMKQPGAANVEPQPTDSSLDTTTADPPHPRAQRILQASRVPSSRLGRLFHYGGLAASLGYGAAAEVLRRTTRVGSDGESSGSLMLTPANVQRLVDKLSRMRGAALKLGQFLSIQDSHVLPKDVEEVFRRVQDSAHYMPNWQMERVMSSSLGYDWCQSFASFTSVPFAAASLGQVHEAVLAAHASPTGNEARVAVKVQFPDVRKSIDSDLGYLTTLLSGIGGVLPKGAFLGKTIEVMKSELADECDYKREADSARFFASPAGLGADQRYRIPWIWEGSTGDVLVMEMMGGVTVGGAEIENLDQSTRDEIAKLVLELCMKELFEFRLMQTDPNWSNFLWNGRTRQIELIDFGATRPYTKSFMDSWMHLLQAAVAEDASECIHWSRQLGYLTGAEGDTMNNAHVQSLTLLATPFRETGSFAFGRGTRWAGITKEIRELIPVMLSERLTPPPKETYSLNRKLSGAFLLASRLNASVDCQEIWQKTVNTYNFD